MQPTSFADVLEAADSLSLDEQQTLLEVLRRRVTERARKAVIHDIEEARREFAAGQCRSASVEELMSEVLS